MPLSDPPPTTARTSAGRTAGPRVTPGGVEWRIAGVSAPQGVRLEVDWVLTADREFAPKADDWVYRLARPRADRLEYRLILRGHPGGDGPRLDPTNPRSIPNPFGDRSEVRFPEYREPEWIKTTVSGSTDLVTLDHGSLDVQVPVRLWSPSGLSAEVPAPLIVANDGSGLADEAALLAWASWHAVAHGPLRVALLDAPQGLRDRWYAANPDYSDQVVENVLPALRSRVRTSAVVGLGISLGALSLLTLHRRHPAALDGLALQSGSFFTPGLDPQESRYAFFAEVCGAVAEITAATPTRTVPTWMSCGAIEENLGNNTRMAEALSDQGYPVVFEVVPDAHTMTGWRDAWAPGLDRLISQLS